MMMMMATTEGETKETVLAHSRIEFFPGLMQRDARMDIGNCLIEVDPRNLPSDVVVDQKAWDMFIKDIWMQRSHVRIMHSPGGFLPSAVALTVEVSEWEQLDPCHWIHGVKVDVPRDVSTLVCDDERSSGIPVTKSPMLAYRISDKRLKGVYYVIGPAIKMFQGPYHVITRGTVPIKINFVITMSLLVRAAWLHIQKTVPLCHQVKERVLRLDTLDFPLRVYSSATNSHLRLAWTRVEQRSATPTALDTLAANLFKWLDTDKNRRLYTDAVVVNVKEMKPEDAMWLYGLLHFMALVVVARRDGKSVVFAVNDRTVAKQMASLKHGEIRHPMLRHVYQKLLCTDPLLLPDCPVVSYM